MQTPREVLTPEALALLQAVAQAGSFAAAARELGLVPSAVFPSRWPGRMSKAAGSSSRK